jgi:hypothetical protein
MPIHATDRATGVELPAPHRINQSVSLDISNAVIWALEMKVDARPQSIRDFLLAVKGAHPRSPIPESARPPAANKAKSAPRTDEAMGCVEIIQRRWGAFPIERPVKVDICRKVTGTYCCEFKPWKSITTTLDQNRLRIELGAGEFELSATCTVPANNGLVFSTKLLESNKCIVSLDDHLTVTVWLERLFDDLYLSRQGA